MPARARLAQTLFIALAAPIAALSVQLPISELRVDGCAHYRQEVVIYASGLRLNSVVGRAELDAAMQRLVDTGFFQTVNYRYAPRSTDGQRTYAVTLEVLGAPAALPVVLDIADVEEAAVWRDLETARSLAGKRIPNNELALAYCRQAIEIALRRLGRARQISATMETELATGGMTVVFKLADRPKVATVSFMGCRQLENAVLTEIAGRLLKGRDYSELDIRRILEANIKPLCEERGLLTAEFTRVRGVNLRSDTVDVLVEINEGPVWMLGNVEMVGDELPAVAMRAAARFGKRGPVDWKKLMATIAAIQEPLQRQGYLKVQSNPERAFRKEALTVDVRVQVTKGLQYVLGTLQISGLSEAAQTKAAKRCKLRAGEPLDLPYLDDYTRAVISMPDCSRKNVSRQLRHRPGTNVVDVLLSFQ